MIFGGKGGGGKTTCATATALRRARSSPRSSFLLVSTDPAHSLSDSLAGFAPPRNLKTLEFDAQQSLATFKENHREQLRQLAARGTFLDDEDISRFLELSLPGLDELMPFLEIARWEREGDYDCIVVDTAPTGHTLRLLAMPELVRKWLAVLDALQAKHHYMQQQFSGSCHRDEVDEFLRELADSVQRMEALLRDPARCRFVPVMIPEVLSIRETATLLDKLEWIKMPVTDVVVNKLYPESDCPMCAKERYRQIQELGDLSGKISRYLLWGAPLYPKEVRGLRALQAFWQKVTALNLTVSAIGPPPLPCPPRQESPADLPTPETELLLFAGKGGVGKSTLACATALRLVRDFPGKEILLFSTDPAHSLSDCLDVKVGSKPTKIAPGLTAVAIDAQAEFEAVKGQYEEELGEILTAISPHLDLTFDREVMERIMDLSPSGLDEVMAVTRMMELLAEGKYDLFILDTAPTGHMIRLLELPELIDQWLKAMFELFLKYRQVFRIPRFTIQMVQMSKNLKRFRGLLQDSGRSSLYAVAILTEMAFEETKDLLAACERLGVSVPTLFLNLATPDGECPLCHALFKRESHIRTKFQRAFSQRQVLLYRQDELRGLDRLTELGEALYRYPRSASLKTKSAKRSSSIKGKSNDRPFS